MYSFTYLFIYCHLSDRNSELYLDADKNMQQQQKRMKKDSNTVYKCSSEISGKSCCSFILLEQRHKSL